MGKNPRKLRNLLINPKLQLRYSVYFIASGSAIMGVMIALIFIKLRQASVAITQSGVLDMESQSRLNDIIFDVTWISLFAFAIFSVIILVYSIIISHRIAGPTVAICAYIHELKDGNLDAKRTLRKYDELHPIMNALQDLSETMKAQRTEAPRTDK